MSNTTETKDLETGVWTIWIDDVCGELAMDKNINACRDVEVIESEVAMARIKELETQLAEAKAELAQVISIGVEMQREANRKLSAENQNLSAASAELVRVLGTAKAEYWNKCYEGMVTAMNIRQFDDMVDAAIENYKAKIGGAV